MTRRRVLNISSMKKKDTMLQYRQFGTAPAQPGFLNLNAGEVRPHFGLHIVPWMCTARDLASGSRQDLTHRTTSSPYIRGLRETVRVTTNTSTPWQWRRICFTFKGNEIYRPAGQLDTAQMWLYAGTNNGWSRYSTSFTGLYSTTVQDDSAKILLRNLFTGQHGFDYSEIIDATTNSQRVKVIYDRKFNIQSPNDSGTMKARKTWIPVNGTLNYDDQEVGDGTSTGIHSVDGRPGVGDIYVVDFFKAHGAADVADSLAFGTDTTLYWHER